MNNLFATGSAVILCLAFAFFFLFTYVAYIWMNRKPLKLANLLGAAMVSILHTFKIVLISFLLLGAVSFIIKITSSF